MFKRTLLSVITALLFVMAVSTSHAQAPMWTLNLLDSTKRSDKNTEKKLGSERMAEKKFTIIRKIFQNNFTHYNYYFNANNKLNAVIERAKASQKDDFTKLIGYYPYSLDNTAAQKQDLDSVIYKATAGILLHDLRNDWIDNMYLLMGMAYYLRKDFDTAAATFQFINYNLFPRKKDEDGSRVIGSTADAAGGTISIANEEKRNVFQKLTAQPPSRNDALVWLARTLIEQNEMGEAAGLIKTLQHDPNLPERLRDDINELNGYWFYKQGVYDSAARYLAAGLTNAATFQDRARSEFLIAQLYEVRGDVAIASTFYDLASLHTTDPMMDIYAQLNNAKMRKGNNAGELERGIDNLVKLTRKDKFETYKDILFYSAGDLALLVPDTTKAIELFNKSLKYNNENTPFKNKAFLQLAEIAYSRKDYKEAYRMYDSLQSGDTTMEEKLASIQNRRAALSKIVEKIFVIEREDSLQHIAAMDPAARELFVKKLSKKLRKEQGVKEDEAANAASGGNDPITFGKDSDKPIDLFASDKNSGEWYFYNASVRSKGTADFKRKWGQRTNADNWRRKAAGQTPAGGATTAQDNIGVLGNMNPDDVDSAPPLNGATKNDKAANTKAKGNTQEAGTEQPEDFSFEGLMAGLPLTPEKLDESKQQVAESLFALGKLFQQELEDYREAIASYDESLRRFPDSVYDGEIYVHLAFCYNKLGDKAKSAYYTQLLKDKFSGSEKVKQLTTHDAAASGKKNTAGTKKYEEIYNLFIEGQFEQAITEKKIADSLYSNNYWSPQLLYIEAVYHIRKKNDSVAIGVLNNIIALYPQSKLKAKAERMIAVLGRRKEIEEYLTNLKITRMTEDQVAVEPERKRMVRNDSTIIKSPSLYDSLKATRDSVAAAAAQTKPGNQQIQEPVKAAPPKVSGPYSFNAAAPHNVIMIMNKVDPTYINEAKNAFVRYVGDNFRTLELKVASDTIDKDNNLLVFSAFATADEGLAFFNKIRRDAGDEISWLPANKYSFLLIDNDNLQRLKTTKDLNNYKALLNKQYPGLVK